MKRIIIYAYNEEIAALRPIAEKLEKQGAAVRFMNIKYDDPAKCDIALAAEVHFDRVKRIFKDMPQVEVKALDTDLKKTIDEGNKGTTPRQGESTRSAESVENTVTVEMHVEAPADDAIPPLVAPPLVNPGPGQDITTIAPRPRPKK